jgi:hypothetical protein
MVFFFFFGIFFANGILVFWLGPLTQWKNNLLMILGLRAQIHLPLPKVEGN